MHYCSYLERPLITSQTLGVTGFVLLKIFHLYSQHFLLPILLPFPVYWQDIWNRNNLCVEICHSRIPKFPQINNSRPAFHYLDLLKSRTVGECLLMSSGFSTQLQIAIENIRELVEDILIILFLLLLSRNFSQKTNEMQSWVLFACFLGEVTARKFCFEINWPLRIYLQERLGIQTSS